MKVGSTERCEFGPVCVNSEALSFNFRRWSDSYSSSSVHLEIYVSVETQPAK